MLSPGERALLLVQGRLVDGLGDGAGRARRAGQDEDQAAPPDGDRMSARIRRSRSLRPADAPVAGAPSRGDVDVAAAAAVP